MSEENNCECGQQPEKPVINFPLKGVELGVNVEAIREVLDLEESAGGTLFSSLEEVKVDGPITLLSVSAPVYQFSVPVEKLEGRIIRLDFSFSVEGTLTAKPSCLWINREQGGSHFIAWYPTANNMSGFISAFMKCKDGVLTLLHNNNLLNPFGCANTAESNAVTLVGDEVAFELAAAPKQDAGSLIFHHVSLSLV